MSVCNWNRVHCGRLRAALDRRRLEVGGRNASSLSCREGSAEYEADLLSTIRSLGCSSGEEEEEKVYCQDKWQEYDLAQEEEPAPANGDGLKWLRNQSMKKSIASYYFTGSEAAEGHGTEPLVYRKKEFFLKKIRYLKVRNFDQGDESTDEFFLDAFTSLSESARREIGHGFLDLVRGCEFKTEDCREER